MTTHHRKTIIACSVAGGGWLIAREGEPAAWVDTGACREQAGQEADRIASLGRALILAGSGRQGRLRPADVSWVLAKPRRVACLIDCVAAFEDPLRVLTTPLRVIFTPRGDVRWHFVPARRPGRTRKTAREPCGRTPLAA